MNINLVAHTAMTDAALATFRRAEDDPTDADHLLELAGRACYQSWQRPNPATARNQDYVANILGKGHESVAEHSTATFYVTGVSRSLTHELIRHRHLSVSELSQRYVDVSEMQPVMPPAVLRSDGTARAEVLDSHLLAAYAYGQLTQWLVDDGFPRKQAREAARSVMPSSTETRIVVTGNMRAWRHVVRLRGSPAADAEIAELAVGLLRHLRWVAPNTFADLSITRRDGREIVE